MIVILGILATVVVFAVGGVTGDGQASICETDESMMASAVEAYLTVNRTNFLPPTGLTGDAYEVTLRSAGLILDVSAYWNIDDNGLVILQPGSVC